MTDTKPPATIYNIPAGLPFADRLAQGILEMYGGDPLRLASVRVFLPTRRACRVLRESFLRLSGGTPLLLPRMQPIGDVHDDEPVLLEALAADDPALADIPPAMPPLRRQMLLARHIMMVPELGAAEPAQALVLATALGRLLDQVHTENRQIADLRNLVPGDEIHWQVTLKFLNVLSETWPQLLAAEGMIDAADRRNRLMRALAAHWRARPPAGPVIAAGTTGSIPATAELLDVIAHLPQGMVVLPGLDQIMDEQSWEALDDTHPQATLRQLLGRLQADRIRDVQLWPAIEKDEQDRPPRTARRWLAAEAMRPAPTSDKWQDLDISDRQRAALRDDLAQAVTLYDCETAQDEAKLIATIIRHTVETPRKTVSVITPDRRLAGRIATICRRWNIEVDDSGGQSLSGSPAGVFLLLAARAAFEGVRPAALMALLHHPLCTLGMGKTDIQAMAAKLERLALRGPKPAPGFHGLRGRIAAAARDPRKPEARDLEAQAAPLIDALERAMQPFMDLMRDESARPLSAYLTAHMEMAEALAAALDEDGQAVPGAARLWRGDDGEAAAGLITSLLEHGPLMGDAVTPEQYNQMLGDFMADCAVRSPTGLHPRIFILGQLEARLVQADVTIMAGLNEGTWPPEPGHDPWLSRTMRRQAGLPSPERSVGLSAHDFVQGFCAPQVIMTRAKRQDSAQAVPARWLQRLSTVLQALRIEPDVLAARADTLDYAALSQMVDTAGTVNSFAQPAPAPPVPLRPRRLSVTEIETWLRDPYAIYAKHVLRLRKLDGLEKAPDAAERGNVLHDALDDFVAQNKQSWPENAATQMYDIGVRAVSARHEEPGFWDFWLPRYRAVCDWFDRHEQEWRGRGFRPLALECSGAMTLPGPAGDFTLRGRIDRVDRAADGRLAVIDYKSGSAGKYSKGKMADGTLPQLPLSALLLASGGVEEVTAADSAYLGYWVLTGATPPGETKSLEEDIEQAVATARDGLAGLIAAFDDEHTPYFALPRPDHLPDFNDYDHLARVQEWTALGESDSDERGGA